MGTESSSEYPLLDELAEEFAARFRRGERPSLKEYADKYPHLAADICELFPALVEMERADEVRQETEQQAQAEEAPRLRQVGDYRILREIGHGGMGVVYEAEQQSLGRRVALKILSHHAAPDAKTLARFRREAKAAARLHHTNIVPVFEVGQVGTTCYYAMQLIQGQSLDQIIEELHGLREASAEITGHITPAERPGESPRPRTGSAALSQVAQSLLTGHFKPRPLANASPLPSQPAAAVPDGAPTEAAVSSAPIRDTTAPAKSMSTTQVAMLPGQAEFTRATASHRHYFRSVARVGQQAAAALAYAHARGVIHRDIKPSNLLLDWSGVVWITDFGLAKAEDDGLTRTGEMPGTLRYMSPERFRGECDARADVYGLGLTLYEMLILKPAFESRDRMHLIEQVGHEEPARPRSVDGQVPLDLETIVLKAIDKEPRRRYQSAEEMAEDLRRFTNDEPIRARRASLPERVARWCRRNSIVAELLAAVIAILLLGTSVATFFAVKADISARQAEANEKQAKDEKREAEFARDRAITALSVSVWLADELEDRIHALGSDDPWDKAFAVVRDVRLRQPDNAAAVLVSARLCRSYADNLRKQGQDERAARIDQESREFYEKLLSLQPDHTRYAGEFASFLFSRLELTGTGPWEVLEPMAMASAGGATLAKQADGSILASGKNPSPETYTITAKTKLTSITAVRLEVLPDRSLPGRGPGRAQNGNFVLNEFQLKAAKDDEPHKARPVVLNRAWANFSQSGWSVADAIDDNIRTGWAVLPEIGSGHVAVFEVNEPFNTANGARLTFTLLQKYKDGEHLVHNIGRFRLSVTSAPEEILLKHRRRTVLQRAYIDSWTKLGAALYFRGEWRSALNVLLKNTAAPSGGNGWDRLLIAQIYLEQDQNEQAGSWFADLFAWMEVNGIDKDILQYAAESMAAGSAGGLVEPFASRLNLTRKDAWEVLEPVKLASSGGTTLVKQPDGSIMAGGKNPFPETYTITAKSRLTGITAVRLELLPDWSLPGHGPGRAYNGNFHLTGFRVKATPKDNANKATPIVLHNAWADFSQFGFPVEAVLGGSSSTSWAVDGETGRHHVALFELKEPLTSANSMMLTFTLEQQQLNMQTICNIGRFRLSVTDEPQAIAAEKNRAALASHDFWTKLAMAFYQRGKRQAALTVLQNVTAERSGGNGRQRLLLAQIHKELGHREEAGKWFDAVFAWIAENGADGEYLQQAGEGLSGVLAHEPQSDNADVRIGRARALSALKQPDKALAEVSKAVELHPKNLAARQTRGEIYLSMKKWDAAFSDYNTLVELKPDDAVMLSLRATLAARSGKYAAAADDFAKLTQMEADEAPASFSLWYRHALTLLAAGKKEEYRKACAGMIEHFKETPSPQVAFFTAWTAALGPDAVADFSPALRLAQKATERDAENPQSHQAVGAILYRMGRLEQCLSHLDAAQAAVNTPNQTSPAYLDYFRAMAHHRLGHKEEARKYFQRAVAQTDKELRDDAQTADLNNWVRKATLQLLRAEAEAVLHESAAGGAN